MSKIYWISFSSEDGPLGVALAKGKDFTEAIVYTHEVGINPGGVVQAVEMKTEKELKEVEELGGVGTFLSKEKLDELGYEPEREVRKIAVCRNETPCVEMDGACPWCLLQNGTHALATAVFVKKDIELVDKGIESIGGLYNYCRGTTKEEDMTGPRYDLLVTAQTILTAAQALLAVRAKGDCQCPQCTARREQREAMT
jgi:hypothetical protein